MATITIKFNFSHDSNDGASHSDHGDLEVEGGLMSDIDDMANDILSDLNEGLEDDEEEWVFDEFEVADSDADLASPSAFDDLDDYAEYIEKCEKHGEGYVLRYEDIGHFDFDDQYNGCWSSEEEWGQNMLDDCFDVPDFLTHYIDIEKWTRDALMDYSVYEGDDGFYIFRD